MRPSSRGSAGRRRGRTTCRVGSSGSRSGALGAGTGPSRPSRVGSTARPRTISRPSSTASRPARLLALLTERQRALVVAQYYLGLSQAETAALFGVRSGTVSATIAQALARMRKGAGHVQ